MPTWFDNTAGTGVLDTMLQTIIDGAASGEVHLVHTYTQGMTYATAIANTLGVAAITSANFSAISAHNTYDRKMSFTGATGAATTDHAGSTDFHILITDGSGVILCATDETSDQPITDLNTLNFPVFDIHALQPTQVP